MAVAMATFFLTKGAGPNWLWRGGRYDPVRNLFFRADGSWRRYGKLGVVAVWAVLALVAYFM